MRAMTMSDVFGYTVLAGVVLWGGWALLGLLTRGWRWLSEVSDDMENGEAEEDWL